MDNNQNKSNWDERTRLLFGNEEVDRLSNAHILVVGLGGVGGYAVEMLARAGVGNMTIVDRDIIQASNINRQIVALNSNLQKSKAEEIAKRLRDINPNINLEVLEFFIKDDNISELLSRHKYDFVLDAIDTLSPKTYLIKLAKEMGLRIISSMGAGAKSDPTKIRIADISKSNNCTLARALRKRLRKLNINKGLPVIYSEELPDENAVLLIEGEQNKKSTAGTVSYIPAVFGCYMAYYVIDKLRKS